MYLGEARVDDIECTGLSRELKFCCQGRTVLWISSDDLDDEFDNRRFHSLEGEYEVSKSSVECFSCHCPESVSSSPKNKQFSFKINNLAKNESHPMGES